MNSFQITSPTVGQAFSVGSVIEAHGRHALDHNSSAWAILWNTYGHYYIQNPPIDLTPDGSWRATNMHLGHDIIEIIFVRVTKDGNDYFLEKVKNNNWGAFDNLPAGTEKLGSVRVVVS